MCIQTDSNDEFPVIQDGIHALTHNYINVEFDDQVWKNITANFLPISFCDINVLAEALKHAVNWHELLRATVGQETGTKQLFLSILMCYKAPWEDVLSKYNVLNVHDTFKLNRGIFMYKHHTNQLPPIFSTYFTKYVQTHNYPTRNAQDYSINITKKMFSDHAIRNCGPSFWNSLDKTVKHCKTTKHFQNELKSVLLSGACLVYLHLFVRCFSF